MRGSRQSTPTLLVLSGILAGWCLAAPAHAQEDKALPQAERKVFPAEFKKLAFRLVGPGAGGRVCRAAGVPGDPRTYYAATAGGGVWKSTDGGVIWKPVFDDMPAASIGSLAIAPSNPNILYVGAGEANIRGNVQVGNGIYKSTDAGKTWKHVWKQEGQIGTMIVHPQNADIAFAAVLGHAFGPNPERGVYRTTDGGKTWHKVLGKNEDTGASDVCFDASNPQILFAGLWQGRRKPWEMISGGPGSGLYRSTDGGETWKQLTEHGLPKGMWGKVGVGVAPSDGRRVYALIEADKGGLFRSDDGGDNWTRVNGGHFLSQRAWYYSTLTIDPKNPDVIWCPEVPMLKSIDGGKTFKKVKGIHHGDNHDIWIDPQDPRRMIVSNDGGVDVTLSGGETWFAPRLPICQFYHVAADKRTPYQLSGNMQDLGTAAGPSNSLSQGGIGVADWYNVGGGETGFTAPDPHDPDIVYAGEYGGYISRFDNRTKQVRNVSVYPTNPSGHAAKDVRYRFQWTAPIMISPHDSKVIYHAANVLFESRDAGRHWRAISPDLTTNDKSKQRWSGGPITGDNTTAEYYCTIFAIAESPRRKGVLWAGSDDGLVHVSRDGGKHWDNVTGKISGLPKWGTVNCIECSPFDAGTAYVVVDAHRLDNMRPYLFKTTDYGETWTSLAGDLPKDAYLHAVREDPKRRGLLYLATFTGIQFSLDDGKHWGQFKLNLPTVEVTDLVVKNDDLVVATNGRSLWIFDDLTPIRDGSWRRAKTGPVLLPTQAAIRWRYYAPVYGVKDRYAQKNPPVGVYVHYFLTGKPKEPLTLDVLDADGNLVNRFSSKAEPPEIPEDDPDAPSHPFKKMVLTTEPGMNRVVWNLQYAGAVKIHKAKIDTGEPAAGPLVLPGTYTLKLTVDGKSMMTRAEVLADPRVDVPLADLKEQLRLTLAIRDSINRLAGDVGRIRSIRTQLEARNTLLKANDKARPLIDTGRSLIKRLDALEAKFHNPKAQVVYDILAQKGGAQLYSKLVYLYELIKDADGPPTQGIEEQYAEQKKELRDYEGELRALVSGDLAKLNDSARKLGVPNVIVPGAK
jgi:photosystem II stability/assembly factor-like uncharacterized protein